MGNNVPWWGRKKNLAIRVKKKNEQDIYRDTCNYFRSVLPHKLQGAKMQCIIS